MKAIVYIRTSTSEQHPENQIPSIEQYCREHDYEIIARVEEKESAFKSGRQLGLKSITDALYDGKRFDALVVWSLDRLSRQGIAHIVNLIQLFKIYNVKVISIQEPWLSADGLMQELLLAVFGWAASYESRIKSERTRAGQDRARKNGTKSGIGIGKRGRDKNPDGRSRNGYLLRWSGKPLKKRRLPLGLEPTAVVESRTDE